MIIEVHRSAEMNGLGYNLKKLNECKAEIIASKWIPSDASGEEIAAILQANVLNRKCAKPFAHLNINPAIEDWQNGLTVEQLAEMSVEAVEKLFPNVPYLIFVHKDISRWHAHAVCPCFTRDGKLISDRFEWNRAMSVSRELEIKYNLERALQHTDERRIVRAEPIQYEAGDLARKIGDVIALAKTYNFVSIGELDAFLRLYNVTVEKTDNDKKHGLTYSVLQDGKRVGRPIIATKIHGASLSAIERHLTKSSKNPEMTAKKDILKNKIQKSLENAINFDEFKNLSSYDVRVVERVSESDGKILGITFVDDVEKIVINGSSVAREFSFGNIIKSLEVSQSVSFETSNAYINHDIPEEVPEEVADNHVEHHSFLGNLINVKILCGEKKRKRRGR